MKSFVLPRTILPGSASLFVVGKQSELFFSFPNSAFNIS